jgi:hypothetical protein
VKARATLEHEGRFIKASGPETKGIRLDIAGIDVQLPSDVYVAHYIVHVQCGVGNFCPEAPIYVLQRGKSQISVSKPTGTMFEERIAPGEEGAFDFLREVLP